MQILSPTPNAGGPTPILVMKNRFSTILQARVKKTPNPKSAFDRCLKRRHEIVDSAMVQAEQYTRHIPLWLRQRLHYCGKVPIAVLQSMAASIAESKYVSGEIAMFPTRLSRVAVLRTRIALVASLPAVGVVTKDCMRGLSSEWC
jgi:hypothetical protein